MTKSKMKSILFKALIGLGFLFGAAMICFAGFIVYIIFFGTSIDTAELSGNLDAFEIAYDSDQSKRDLPEEFKIVESYCSISEDEKFFTYTFKIQNLDVNTRSFAGTIFYTSEYLERFGEDITNPLYRVNENQEVMIESAGIYEIEVNGIILDDVESFKEYFDEVAFEIISDAGVGRIYLPVSFEREEE